MLPVPSLAVALALAAAAPTPAPVRPPVAPKSSPATVLVRSPKAGLPDLRAFLAEAGQWAPMLRPVEFGKALGAVLGTDLLDPAALQAAGADGEAPMSVSFLREATVVCLSTVKGGKALERARATLAGSGQPAKQAYKGAQLEGAVAAKVWRAGVATKGSAMCLASGGTDALAALKEAVDALGGQGLATSKAVRAAAGLDAPVMGYFQVPGGGGAFEIRAAKSSLELVGRAALEGQPLGKAKDGDVLVGLSAEAPMVLRAQLTPKAMADPGGAGASVLQFLASNACKGCDPVTSQAILAALKPELVGTVAALVEGIDPAGALQRPARYYLFPHAYVLPVKDPAKAEKALESSVKKLEGKGAKLTKLETAEGSAWSVALGDREVRVGVEKGVLFIGNHAGAVARMLGALGAAKPAKAEHAMSFTIDGPRATAALRRISIMDVPKSPELAGLFAVGVEIGSLLKAAKPITGWADPDGAALKFQAKLELNPVEPMGPAAGK
ncbi:MAG TPA: hypothetical protein VGK67_35205 [Myxococcales bacterium]